MKTKIEKIAKSYTRTISVDRDSWIFSTKLSEEVEIGSKEELIDASQKLFQQCKLLTLKDIRETLGENYA